MLGVIICNYTNIHCTKIIINELKCTIAHTEADNSHEIINLQRRRRHPYDLPSAPNIRPNLFIDIQKGIEQQAIRRQEERNLEAIMRLHPNGPYMPPRLINSSAICKFNSILCYTFSY